MWYFISVQDPLSFYFTLCSVLPCYICTWITNSIVLTCVIHVAESFDVFVWCRLPFFKITVPTVDIVRCQYVVSALLSNNCHCLLGGPVGAGKEEVWCLLCVTFVVVMVADIKITVFWDVTWVKVFHPDEGDSRFLQNMSAYVLNCRAHIPEDHTLFI